MLLFVIGMVTGIVGIFYPRIAENNPLLHPIKVVSVSGSKVVLADGRRIELQGQASGDETWASVLEKSQYMVDIEPVEGGDIAIYGSVRAFICGTPWAQPICIPLIPVDLKRYHRKCLGYGTEAWVKIEAEQRAAVQPPPAPAQK